VSNEQFRHEVEEGFAVAFPKLREDGNGGELHLQAARGLQPNQIIFDLVFLVDVVKCNRAMILYPWTGRQNRQIAIKTARETSNRA